MSTTPDYSTITEAPGTRASADQLRILCTRYQLAADHSKDGDVLEVACGAGTGLGFLAQSARRVFGGDIDASNCRRAARAYYSDPRIGVLSLDAQKLPFPDGSFDTVVFFEALYYLEDANRFFTEARRVLRKNGTVVISSVNCEWSGFNASPFSTKYFTASELATALRGHSFGVRMLAGFPDEKRGFIRKATGAVRKVAVRFHLIPRTMKGKELLKRLFYGELAVIPDVITRDLAPVEPLVDFDPGDKTEYRMFYALGVAV